MTKDQLNSKIDKELTPTENALINFNIYLNPDHVEYYQNYHLGNYQFCYDYLIKNRHLLTIEHTPTDKREVALMTVAMANVFYS